MYIRHTFCSVYANRFCHDNHTMVLTREEAYVLAAQSAEAISNDEATVAEVKVG